MREIRKLSPDTRLHFMDRWEERGDPDSISAYDLCNMIVEEHQKLRQGHHSDILSWVFDDRRDGRGIYRFLVDERPFYAVINKENSRLMTVYDHAQLQQKRRWRRSARKAKSHHGAAGDRTRRRLKGGSDQ